MSRLFAVLIALVLLPAAAQAGPQFTDPARAGGAALYGYDPVAYFTVGEPVMGSADFTATHNGAVWWFASAANRDAFTADPAAYAPQYDGHCAFAASRGYKASADPTAWQIVDDKLYVNFNRLVHLRWKLDIPGNIAEGDRHWPTVNP